MRITTKGCYGLRAMIELATQDDGQPLSMEMISESRQISRKYLHALMTSLRSAGLVKSVRGPGGGYTLSKAAKKINIKEILQALEGPLAPSNCVEEPDTCERSHVCPMIGLWNKINDVTEKLLENITLQDVADEEKGSA